MVCGPAFDINLFTRRMLAKVPRAIISSLPLLDPYELKSFGVNLKHKNSAVSERISLGTKIMHMRTEMRITLD